MLAELPDADQDYDPYDGADFPEDYEYTCPQCGCGIDPDEGYCFTCGYCWIEGGENDVINS